MTGSRFALYLLPPYPLARDIAEVHSMLRKQFGFAAADRFPVHCTVKGFFKKNEKPVDRLVEELDAFFTDRGPLPVSIENQRVDPIGFGLSLLNLDGKPNQPFLKLREEVVEIILPYIADDCDFREHDLGHPYHPHITFAFRDIPNELYENVFAWLAPAPEMTGQFSADTYHFLEFFSDDWPGNWWETIRWRLIRSWRLEERA